MKIKTKLDHFDKGIVGISSCILQGWNHNSIKQELLLFDALGVTALSSLIEEYEYYPDFYKQELSDIEYLFNKDVLFSAYPAAHFPKYKEVEEVLKTYRELGIRSIFDDGEFTDKDDNNHKAYEIRCSALHHQLKDGLPTIPVIEPTVFPSYSKSALGSAAQVVINTFPCIDYNQLSFDDVLQLREEKEVSEYKTSLRRWIKKMDSENLNKYEIKDELDYLLSSYEKYMKLMKLKYSYGSLQSLVNISMSSIENLIKFNLKELSNGIFDIKARKIALTEAELKAPGKELAYIHLLKERF